jgi:hypothetical protein
VAEPQQELREARSAPDRCSRAGRSFATSIVGGGTSGDTLGADPQEDVGRSLVDLVDGDPVARESVSVPRTATSGALSISSRSLFAWRLPIERAEDERAEA